jgi:hypothetical protein
MGRLERKLDTDLIDRILANGPIKKQPRTKSKKTPRVANTYRGHPERVEARAERKAIERKRARETPAPQRGVRLNRSRKWRPAKTYAEARAQSLPVAAE